MGLGFGTQERDQVAIPAFHKTLKGTTMSSSDDISPAVDARLRRLAARKGYMLRRSRRALGLDNAGGYMILEPSRNFCLQGFNFDCGPEFVEAWLEECEPGPLAI